MFLPSAQKSLSKKPNGQITYQSSRDVRDSISVDLVRTSANFLVLFPADFGHLRRAENYLCIINGRMTYHPSSLFAINTARASRSCEDRRDVWCGDELLFVSTNIRGTLPPVRCKYLNIVWAAMHGEDLKSHTLHRKRSQNFVPIFPWGLWHALER